MLRRLTSALVFAVILLCTGWLTLALGAEGDIAGQMGELKDLHGEAYVRLRDLLLTAPGALDNLQELADTSEDWHVRLLCEAMIYRKENPQKAKMLDRWWGGTEGLSVPRGVFSYRDAGATTTYGLVLALHFGPEAGPLVGEKILHLWTHNLAFRQAAMRALVILRNEHTPSVFGAVASSSEEKTELRTQAILGLAECLEGRPAYEMRADQPAFLVRPFLRPPQLAPFRKEHCSFPVLKLSDEERADTEDRLVELLKADTERVRVAAAYALQYASSAQVVDHLSQRLDRDKSRWVRAWSAEALRAIGGDDAEEHLAEARRTERDAEVIQVIDGERHPLWPGTIMRDGSILAAPRK